MMAVNNVNIDLPTAFCFWYDIIGDFIKRKKMEFFRRHRKIIVIFLTIFLTAWMVGITAVLSVLLSQ